MDINTAFRLVSLLTATEKIFLKSPSYDSFVNAIRSPATKKVYVNSLKRYMNHLKLTSIDLPKVIESKLIDYIMSLRNDGISYSRINI